MEKLFDLLFDLKVLSALIVVTFVLLFSYVIKTNRTEAENPLSKENKDNKSGKKKETSNKQKRKVAETKWSKSKSGFSHPWLLSSLKGHTGNVLDMDFSQNGKYLVSCSDDRTVFLWDVKDVESKDHRSVRINIPFDHATFSKWSPYGKAFLTYRYQDNAIEVYKVEKKGNFLGNATSALTFPTENSDEKIAMDIASTGKFIMTCTEKHLLIWTPKGQKLAEMETCLLNTWCAKISPCGKFVAASGFSPDAIVWEVIFNKTGEYQEIKRAFELTGHSSGIYDVAFDAESSKAFTVSKDGSWKIFDINVEYKKKQSPRLLLTSKYENPSDHKALIAYSSNSVVAIAVYNTIYLYSAINGKLDAKISDIYSGAITKLMFDGLGHYLFAAGPRTVHIFHNVTGYKTNIHIAKEKLKEKQTSATKERLEKQIEDCEHFLKNIQN